MEWIDRLNQSITYIENNLDKEISYEEASRVACCSTFHYQRMFSYIAGVSLSEYIRRRRMTKAFAPYVFPLCLQQYINNNKQLP